MSLAPLHGMSSPDLVRRAAEAFIAIAGREAWQRRIAQLEEQIKAQRIAGRIARQRHALELALDRLAASEPASLTAAERAVAALAAEAVAVRQQLSPAGCTRFDERLAEALSGDGTLVPLFHLLRTAARQRQAGFEVRFSGFEDGTSYDLLLAREGREAEVVCAVFSADEGRWVHRRDWFALVDRINPDLQAWLAAHPGRYLLKVTLPEGLDSARNLAAVQARIGALLVEERKADYSETAVLRLDPLLVAQAEAGHRALLQRLKGQFGEETHFAVAAGEGSLVVLAARASRPNEIAAVLQRRLADLPSRLSGTRPGILAVFVEDTEPAEWRALRERLELEAAARNFLTAPEARAVIAVSCASRFELLGQGEPLAAKAGELRFRNPSHPKAKDVALLPAVESRV